MIQLSRAPGGEVENILKSERQILERNWNTTRKWGGLLPFYPGWYDKNCGAQLQYICQKAVNHPIMTTTSTTPSTTPSTNLGKSIIISRLVLVKHIFLTFSWYA